jgi:hypothetical protein
VRSNQLSYAPNVRVSIAAKAGFGKCSTQIPSHSGVTHDVGLGTGEGATSGVTPGVAVGGPSVGVGTGCVAVGNAGKGVGETLCGSGKRTRTVPQIMLSATRALMIKNKRRVLCPFDIRLTPYLLRSLLSADPHPL